jgi:hypothetical protein
MMAAPHILPIVAATVTTDRQLIDSSYPLRDVARDLFDVADDSQAPPRFPVQREGGLRRR